MKMKQFVNKNNIELEILEKHPHQWTDGPHGHYQTRYRLRLKVVDGAWSRQWDTPFFKGEGGALNNDVVDPPDPTVEEVLNVLADDSATVDQNTFTQWCGELGYDDDSIKAHNTYKEVQDQAAALRELIGDKVEYDKLLYKVERL